MTQALSKQVTFGQHPARLVTGLQAQAADYLCVPVD
jgi:hypothetical protein